MTVRWGKGARVMVLGAIAALIIGVVAFPSAAQDASDGGKLSRDIEQQVRVTGSDDLLPVIIQTRDEPTSGHFARLHSRGGSVKTRYAAIRGYSAKLPASQIEALADDPEVERISSDAPVRAHLDVAYKAVRADVAFASSGGLNGTGIAVAIIDTGVQGHQDLLRPKGSPQIVEVEVVDHESGLADYFGHGTHVAGIINGNGSSSSDKLSFRTFKGLAPGARLISIRALQHDGNGFTSDIISGIDWAVRNRATYNIRVLNLSLGHPVFESYKTDPLCRAVRAAYEAGIVVVVAAGNDGTVGSGYGTITSPANEPSAITVGAMDDSNTITIGDDVLAWYSSKGPSLIDFVVKPDLVAPGTWIVSARAVGSFLDTAHHDQTLQVSDYRNDPKSATNDGAYYTMAGTSMAAPMVSATAALLLQKEPGLNAATVKARLMRSAVKDNRLAFETGAGYLDVEAALKETGSAKAAFSPRAMVASDLGVYVEDTRLIWGGQDWSLGAIWGGGKGSAKGILLTDVPDSIVTSYGAIWGGGKAGSKSIVENNQVTGSGVIWNGDACSLSATTGTVQNQGAIWGGGKK